MYAGVNSPPALPPPRQVRAGMDAGVVGRRPQAVHISALSRARCEVAAARRCGDDQGGVGRRRMDTFGLLLQQHDDSLPPRRPHRT